MSRIVVIQSILPRASSWSPIGLRGGHVACVVQWLIGLEQLGHDVLFINPIASMAPADERRAANHFASTMTAWWHLDRSGLLDSATRRSVAGRSYDDIAAFASTADALLTIALTGSSEPPPPLERIRPRIFIDHDPGYTQLWADMHGAMAIIGDHDIYFTVGANVGTNRCTLPTNGLQWHHVWNPVVASWWPVDSPISRNRWTTIGEWWGQPYAEFEGRVLGPKRDEFLKFLPVPRLASADIELALDIPVDDADIPTLQAHGWRVTTPREAESVTGYRAWVSGSLGEFSCVKGVYAGTGSGWFSDRSAAYLACGRPVIVQDTGLSHVLPTGEGLLTFRTVPEAVAAIHAVQRDYTRHSQAARRIAEQHFDAAVTLPRLLRAAAI